MQNLYPCMQLKEEKSDLCLHCTSSDYSTEAGIHETPTNHMT